MAENDLLKVSLGVHINILYMSDPPKGCPIKLTKNSLNSSVFADIFQLSAFSGQIILIFAVILHPFARAEKLRRKFGLCGTFTL